MDSHDIDVRSLVIGQPLPHDLNGSDGLLLLRGGVNVTRTFVDRLLQRGVTTVCVVGDHAPEAGEPELAYRPARVPQLTADQVFTRLPDATTVYHEAVDTFTTLAEDVIGGRVADAGPAYDLVAGFNQFLEADAVLLSLTVKLRGTGDGGLMKHALKSCMLSMVLAQQMGFDQARQADTGVAALLHDLGMTLLKQPVHQKTRPLTQTEREVVQTHPDLTLRILDGVRGLSQPVRHAAYQVHERRDGRGYPRGRNPMFVSPYAKIIAVADAYAALTADRPWRPAFSGHEAMKILLADTAGGRFDRAATRGLLDSISMFPVGTRVGLSDDRKALVLRGVPGANVRPVVVALKMDGTPGRREIDLSQPGQPAIVAVHPDPAGDSDAAVSAAPPAAPPAAA